MCCRCSNWRTEGKDVQPDAQLSAQEPRLGARPISMLGVSMLSLESNILGTPSTFDEEFTPSESG